MTDEATTTDGPTTDGPVTTGAESRRLLPIATTRQTWAALRAEFARLPALSAVAGTLLVAAAAGGLVAPWVLGRLVDDVIAAAGTTRIVAWAGVIAGAALLAGLLTAAGAAVAARLGETVLARLRERVLDRALHLPSATLERAGTGDLVARAGDDVAVVTNVITTSGPAFVGALLSIVLTALGLFALDWRLGLAGLAAAPAYALALRWYLRRSVPYYARERVATGERAQAMAGVAVAARRRCAPTGWRTPTWRGSPSVPPWPATCRWRSSACTPASGCIQVAALLERETLDQDEILRVTGLPPAPPLQNEAIIAAAEQGVAM